MSICNVTHFVVKSKSAPSRFTLRNNITDGCIIGFRVNFIEDIMEIFYNGDRLGVLWENIPKSFTIVMCSYRDKKDDVQITQRLDNFNNAVDYYSK